MANSIPHHRDVRTLAHVDLTYPNNCAALSRLLDVALLPAAENDLPRILQIVISDVRDTVGCERVRWFVIDDVTQELYTRVATELENSEIRHKLGKGITGRVAQHRQQTHVPHPSGEERWDPTTDHRTGFVTRNLLCVPVISSVDQRLVGVLPLLNKSGTGLSTFDEQLIQTFSAHAATALERRRLQEEASHSK